MGNRKAPTPVDSHQVKPEPPPAPPAPQPCGFPLCPAFAVDKHEHCPVHSPAKVLERAKAIVAAETKAAIERVQAGDGVTPSPLTINLLLNLRERILFSLDRTV